MRNGGWENSFCARVPRARHGMCRFDRNVFLVDCLFKKNHNIWRKWALQNAKGRRNDLKTTNVVNIEDNMSFNFLIDKQATLFAYLWVWDKDRDTLVLVHWMYLTLFVLWSTVFVHAVRHTVNIPLTLLVKLNKLSTALIPSILSYNWYKWH